MKYLKIHQEKNHRYGFLIKEKYNINEVIFVADSGLISNKNTQELHSNDVSFIMGARIKNRKN